MSCNLRLDIKYGQVENSDSEWDMNSRSLETPSRGLTAIVKPTKQHTMIRALHTQTRGEKI